MPRSSTPNSADVRGSMRAVGTFVLLLVALATTLYANDVRHLETIDVIETDREVSIVLEGSSPLRWRATSNGDALSLRLLETAPTDAVKNRDYPYGLIRTVEVRREAGDTLVDVKAAQPIAISTRASGSLLIVEIAARSRTTRRTPPQRPPALRSQKGSEPSPRPRPVAPIEQGADRERGQEDAPRPPEPLIPSTPEPPVESRSEAPREEAADSPTTRPFERGDGAPERDAPTSVIADVEASGPVDAATSPPARDANTFPDATDGVGEENGAGEVGYAIGPRDLLTIEVFGVEQLTRQVRVLQDGSISFPPLGSFRVAGSSPRDVELDIARRLGQERIRRDAQVSVFVDEAKSSSIYVQGSVEEPGTYPKTGPMTLLQILGEAGGLTDSPGTIYVVRDDNGREKRIEIDGRRLFESGDLDLNLQLRSGDIVIVPKMETLRVYVNGAVEQPGPVEYTSRDGITVLQAVTAAGGTNERASEGRVFILRTAEDGEQSRIRVHLKKIKRGTAPDIALEPNDVVVVGEWLF